MLKRSAWSRARRFRRPLPPAWQPILEQRVAYYRCLPEPAQAELRGLLHVLLGEVPFEPGGGLQAVEEEMRVIVAAQAAVLLLGRPLGELPDLRSVIVYPGAYRARERLHTDEGTLVESSEVRRGEAWAHGVLLLSWDDVAYDAAHVDDGENIVFHEMAHALDDLTGETDGVPPQPDAEHAAAWVAAFEPAYKALVRSARLRRETLLDPYAAEEPAEFFAVATETFLEMPLEFRAEYPELYRLLRAYFRLDPAAWAGQLTEARRAVAAGG